MIRIVNNCARRYVGNINWNVSQQHLADETEDNCDRRIGLKLRAPTVPIGWTVREHALFYYFKVPL